MSRCAARASWFKSALPEVDNETLQGFYNVLTTVVSTPNVISGFLAMVMNVVLPDEPKTSG
ncbi:hypothetical protein BCR43DRAFT_491011 [Syncephalastrum racemosum]|uniref:Uncharacterized protein n=1 Tax=Syncephalastrum racemosum TaxID=13706 RepID=A0A1X2HGV0_SYNRA|nr:hypothetical protein BCR43DRAFT_491011 [Syncephalastrum racemosum]